MRLLRIALLGVVAVTVLFATLVWLTRPSAGSRQVLIAAKTNFTNGRFSVYAQPWGGELVAWTRPWSRFADTIVVDLQRFPAGTEVHWRWPPVTPSNGPGVWGYDQVSHGNYDGAEPEEAVAPIRVRDLKRLQQSFSWTISERFGSANVLTEFYLRTSATDVESKRLEVGWLLHMPPSTRRFFDRSRLVGVYSDERGRRWAVRMAETFCMFGPEEAGDVPSGSIDMLRALRWLQAKRLVAGDEWVWGVAIGAEPVQGFGSMTLGSWQVARN